MANFAWDPSRQRIGIVVANHTGYVKSALTCMASGDVVVPLRSAYDTSRIEAAIVNQVITPASGSAWMQPTFAPPAVDATALISFTSGTEGTPKGVILTHGNLANVVTRLNQVMQINGDIREYVGVPVYHSFGFGRCRAIAAVGGSFFVPSDGFNPAQIGAMLRRGEINAISAVPSLWRLLLANQDLIGPYGKKLRWIEIGSQYMSRQEKEALKSLFPEARIVQHYGLTEASRTTFLEIHQETGEALESVGRTWGDVSVKISETGRIAIAGDHVAQTYLIDGQQKPLQDQDCWFVTNDLGRWQDGALYYQGRADDVINCGGIKIQPEALETKVYARMGYNPGVAICRKSDPIRGEGFLVAVTKDADLDRQSLQAAVLQATQELGVNAANAIALVEVDSLPKTASGKIQRKQLAEWYAKELSAEQSAQSEFTQSTPPSRSPIQAIFCRVLNLRAVCPQDSFISLGGDSLTYVQLSMALERQLQNLPQGWETMSISQLEQPAEQRQRFVKIETNILLRALSIFGVVVNHADLFPMLAGGSMLLLLIAGLNLARFQGTALMQGQFAKPMLSLLRNLILPYWVIAFAFQLYKREFDLSILFLFSNFITPNVGAIFPIWFISVLVQNLILFALLFSIQPIRNWATTAPWRFGLGLVAIAVASHVCVPYLWDTDYLYNRLPHMMVWLFAVGWCIYFAQSRMQKWVTTVVLLVVMAIMLGVNGPLEHNWWIWIGSLALLWTPYVVVPQGIRLSIQTLGASAYYVYLTHMIFIHVVRNVAGIPNPWLNAVLGLVGGIGVWAVVEKWRDFWGDRKSPVSSYPVSW